jgi:hypothetical protein
MSPTIIKQIYYFRANFFYNDTFFYQLSFLQTESTFTFNKIMSKIIFGTVLLLLIGLIIGCNSADQTDEANLLINEAKQFSDNAGKYDIEFTGLMNNILNLDLENTENIQIYRKNNKSKFDELIKLGELLNKNRGEVVLKLEQASKLNLNDKFKDYLELKVKENKKLAEIDRLKTKVAAELLKAENGDDFKQSVKNYDLRKIEDSENEAANFSNKAEQVVKENPNVFEKK